MDVLYIYIEEINLNHNDASIKNKIKESYLLSFKFEAYGGHNSTKTYEFTEGTPIGFAYFSDTYKHTIINQNSFVYIHYTLGKWYIECYTRTQYNKDTTIDVIVLYV